MSGTTLLLLSGSLRRDSYNTRLLRHLARHLDGRCGFDMPQPDELDLPLFNEDLEQHAALHARVLALHRRLAACDGIIVASPEYNGQPGACLKNLIDWVSRLAYLDARLAHPFLDLPVLLCSASTGWSGGAVALPHARALFGYVGALVNGETICVPYADQAWDGEAYQFDPFFSQQTDACAQRFLQLVRRCAHARPAQPETPL